MPAYAPIEERFFRHFIPEPNSGCWIWMGATIKSRRGGIYGVIGVERAIRIKQGKTNALAHRISYQIHKGKLSDDLQVDHNCQNTLCVNPDHLDLRTSKEHGLISHQRKYGNACRKGHKFTSKNTWFEKNGQRHCRRCHADIEAARRKQKKEQFTCQPI